ncbi:MAG: molybdopterin molybdotransferase MoeA [Chloroflexi bacterium]|nr:molybdopterin molybdotransferase MoeA [Chloroflexota bacterium]MCL5274319.1 molybdopterin molybdotransferase MoeA [Chloroflexota bacterium]
MRTFDLLSPADALAKLYGALDVSRLPAQTEVVPAVSARNRVLARDVASPIPLPEFRRSTVDGYAVRAGSTPGVLRVVGEVRMGELTRLRVKLGDAALIHTGGNVPEGADAVVMVEQVKFLDQSGLGKIQTQTQASPGDNTIRQGEDVQQGEIVMRAGARLREPEIGGLLSIGMTEVEVYRKPRVALIASGDEVVPAEAETQPGQVRNINTPMLAALVERNGGVALDYGILPDSRFAFEEAAARAMQEADMVVFMAGSSVSERDFTPDVVDGMGKPGILVHGIAFRPGKPTLFAVADGRPVFGLPGNPVSAFVTASLFVAPTLWRMQHAVAPMPGQVKAVLSKDVRSPGDLEHWFPVNLSQTAEGQPHGSPPVWSAEPVATKSNLIFSLVRASGLVCAPIGMDRLAAGATVDVRLLD